MEFTAQLLVALNVPGVWPHKELYHQYFTYVCEAILREDELDNRWRIGKIKFLLRKYAIGFLVEQVDDSFYPTRP